MQNKKNKKLKGVSLFTGAGIGETYFKDLNIEIVVANELLNDRAKLYSQLYPETRMITGDICNKQIFNQIIKKSGKIDFLLATPPCQGISVAGKNRTLQEMMKDKRNHLIFKIIDFINIKKPDYVLIENVPNFLKLKLPHKKGVQSLLELLIKLYDSLYNIDAKVLDTSDYGIPQRRNRAVIKMNKKNLKWDWPKKTKRLTVKDVIGHLPSLEAGEKSNINWHFARKHSHKHITWMKHTPTGETAFDNEKYYPKKDNGHPISSYNTTYRRIKWNEPAPTITMRNDAISSQLNVHPGRRLKNGVYSDARVLTPLELMLLSSLPKNWHIPIDTPELLIRKCIGESVPPLLLKKIVAGIK